MIRYVLMRCAQAPPREAARMPPCRDVFRYAMFCFYAFRVERDDVYTYDTRFFAMRRLRAYFRAALRYCRVTMRDAAYLFVYGAAMLMFSCHTLMPCADVTLPDDFPLMLLSRLCRYAFR